MTCGVLLSEPVGFTDTACKIKHGALSRIPVVTALPGDKRVVMTGEPSGGDDRTTPWFSYCKYCFSYHHYPLVFLSSLHLGDGRAKGLS